MLLNRESSWQAAYVIPKGEADRIRERGLESFRDDIGKLEPFLREKTGEYVFYDCSAESPKGRRSLCYDCEALESRKEHRPEDNAVDMAAAMSIELFNGRTISRVAETRKFRYENVELGENTF